MNDQLLEQAYKERLDERIISCLAERCGMSLDDAMDLYYHSRLAEKISQGKDGVQYLDHKVLVRILYETEYGLFEKKHCAGHP